MRRMLGRIGGVAITLLPSLAVATPLHEGSAKEVRDDYDMICHAVERSGAAKVAAPSDKAKLIADYLLSHLRTKQAMRTMQSLASERPENKAGLLKRAAREAGYSGACPFADEK